MPLQDGIDELPAVDPGIGLTSDGFCIGVLSGVGVVMVANGLMPLLLSSVAPRGILTPTTVDPLLILVNPDAVPELVVVDPQRDAVLEPAIVDVLDVAPNPPPSKPETLPLLDVP
jgi:hypothetical protein